MTTNLIQQGDSVEYTASADISSGDVVLMNTIIGIASTDIKNTESGTVSLKGVYKLDKATGIINQGAKVYWDSTNERVTTTAASNTYCGVAHETAASADTEANININFGN